MSLSGRCGGLVSAGYDERDVERVKRVARRERFCMSGQMRETCSAVSIPLLSFV
jgi:hypothetical protein